MLGFSYLSVPLYKLYCQTFGLGGFSTGTDLDSSQSHPTIDNREKTPTEIISNNPIDIF
jgi:cytochrome c oxidase assembly protein Cox11